MLVAGLLAAALLAAQALPSPRRLPEWVGRLAVGVALVAALAGPTAYSLQTAATPHTGAIPSAGPATAGGRRRARRPGGSAGRAVLTARPGVAAAPGVPAGGGAPGGAAPGGGAPGGAAPGGAAPGGGPRGGMGGLLGAGTPGDEVVRLLDADADDYTWVAAAVRREQRGRLPVGHR